MLGRAFSLVHTFGTLALGLGAALATSGCRTSRAPTATEPAEHAVRTGEAFSASLDATRGEAVISFRGKRVLVYAFADSQFKPYVRELYTLRGENVVRDAPSDHLHHHGLMFAVQVNEVNFWEERGTPGRQVSDRLPIVKTRRSRTGLPEAEVVHVIRWQPPGNDAPTAALLVEERTLKITVNPGVEEVSVAWQSRFQVGPGVPQVALAGAEYNGLGMRLPAEFDHVAIFQNSAGLPYSEAQTFDVRRARWSSVAGRLEGREVMVALASRPGNPGDPSFFSMRNAFAYLAATQGWGKQPQTFARGDRFELSYLVLVYPAHQNVTYLGTRFESWLGNR